MGSFLQFLACWMFWICWHRVDRHLTFFWFLGGLKQPSKVYCCKDVEKRGDRLDQVSIFHLPSPHYESLRTGCSLCIDLNSK